MEEVAELCDVLTYTTVDLNIADLKATTKVGSLNGVASEFAWKRHSLEQSGLQ